VRCEYRDGVLTLRGRVRPTKQLAQAAVRLVDRAIVVDNQIRVGAVATQRQVSLEQVLASLQRQHINKRAAGKDAEAPEVAP
jgi:hypothetical protein